MATQQQEGAAPISAHGLSGGPNTTNPHASGQWYGWPSKEMNPVNLPDEEGRVKRVRTPVMDLEGLITPTELHYVVQHFDVPEVIPADKWTLTIDGEVKYPFTINYDDLRLFPGRTVRTVMECSGSDATYFQYFKGEGSKPSRTQECMILSASEWTGTPLVGILEHAGLTDKALYIRTEGWDEGLPGSAAPGTKPFSTIRPSQGKSPSPRTQFSPGPRTGSAWSTCMARRCGFWYPDGPAIGPSSGCAASK